jgi:hypothetical protein
METLGLSALGARIGVETALESSAPGGNNIAVTSIGQLRGRQVPEVPISASGPRIRVETALENLALGDHDVAVSAVARLRDRQILVNTSANLHWKVTDAASIPRKWGPQVKGVAVDLTLDKDTYELGRDIPLHIAMENFAAEVPIIGDNPIWDPPAVKVEMRDSCGLRIEPHGGAIWMGHGGCGQYLRGEIVLNELTLNEMGLLPDHPGSYTVVAVWSPSTGADMNCGMRFYPPYVTVGSAPATFRVVDEKHLEPLDTAICTSTPANK